MDFILSPAGVACATFCLMLEKISYFKTQSRVCSVEKQKNASPKCFLEENKLWDRMKAITLQGVCFFPISRGAYRHSASPGLRSEATDLCV